MRLFTIVSIFALQTAFASAQAAVPLFSKGTEVFNLTDPKGAPLKRTVLADSSTKKMMAAALVMAVNALPETEPKLQYEDGIEVKFEKLSFIEAGQGRLKVEAQVSGHELEIKDTISAADFKAGKQITMKFQPVRKELSQIQLNFKGGTIQLRLNPKANEITIANADAGVNVEMPFVGSASESLRLSGKGTRATK